MSSKISTSNSGGERAQLAYAVPWRLVFGLGPHIANGTRTSVDAFSAGICAQLDPPPEVVDEANLPDSARFVLVANHYQRKGMWILHPAAALTQAIRKHYGPSDPPVRWMVTANWPRIQMGPFSFPSPGDLLLPRVAEALACYPVAFAGSNRAFTARSLRRILREAPKSDRPLGVFPEGVAGTARRLSKPLPGIERLLTHLAKAGMPILPAGLSEKGRLIIRFGQPINPAQILSAGNAAELAMQRVSELI